MSASARSAVTLSVLGVLVVVAALWGWAAATQPLPGKVDTPVCVTRAVSAGDKVYPQDVTVSVYNAGTRDGLAGRVKQQLSDIGFSKGTDANAPSDAKVSTVQIWTTQPTSPAVLLVASWLGKSVDIERREGIGPGVTVVVGDKFTQVSGGRRGVVAKADAFICSPPVG
ncbi:LytR C-terminal domain-containing protein [Nocardioides sp.]|uniref:LytR C-terminal domain-containing protein n=1 Tax=Nocardioides sp. TaxID=35761 RepID=UPI003784AF2F